MHPPSRLNCNSPALDYTASIMKSKSFNNDGPRRSLALVLLGVIVVSGSCRQETGPSRSGSEPLLARTVTDMGHTLDENAHFKEVAYVLLRAIKDDVEAGDDVVARQAAFERQLAVCAPDYIFKRALMRALGREQAVRDIVWHWAPTLAHYKDDFPLDYQSFVDRSQFSRVAIGGDKESKQEKRDVRIELADPSGDPNASVVAGIRLEKENGLWRVSVVGFDRVKRHLNIPGLER